MRKIISGLFAIILTASVILAVNPSFVLAWEQGEPDFKTHQEINAQALSRFFKEYRSDAKYVNAAIDETQSYRGPEVVSCSLRQSGLKVLVGRKTFEEWVKHGGYSADEPHLWASVRHFYDPLAANGVPQLTDHNWVHGQIYDAISAKDWTFKDTGNPFRWWDALRYYRMAMEIPEDSQIREIPASDFRDTAFQPTSPAEAREFYLGKAFRSLGETMHMIADLTQPCHVRNDSHPTGDLDPLESTVTKDTVVKYAKSPVDPRIGSEIDTAGDVETMYEKLALYTNEHFYTYDTIYDDASGVDPRNGEKPNRHPQFSDLVLGKLDPIKTYYGEFNGKLVPMIQESFVSIKKALASETEFIMPPSFTDNQSEVLLPIAIKADLKLINLFFPTMELKMNVEENEDIEQESSGSYKEFWVNGEMKHLYDKDVEWKNKGWKIMYSGPAEVWCERRGKALHIGDTEFEKGWIKEIPLIVYTGEAPEQTDDEKIKKYQVENEDALYLVIKAGGRTFTSNKHKIVAKPQIRIDPSKLDAEVGTYTFTASVDPSYKNPTFIWDINGSPKQNGPKNTFSADFKSAGTYKVGVTLADGGKELCTATATVIIRQAAQTPTPVTAPTPTPPTGTGWYLDGAPVIQKGEMKNDDCRFGKQLSISDGSASGSMSFKDCVTHTKCSGTYTGSVTWTPPPSFMQPGSKINFTVSEKLTEQDYYCGSQNFSAAGGIKVDGAWIAQAMHSRGVPTATGTYTVRTGSPGAKMIVYVFVTLESAPGSVTYNYTYR